MLLLVTLPGILIGLPACGHGHGYYYDEYHYDPFFDKLYRPHFDPSCDPCP